MNFTSTLNFLNEYGYPCECIDAIHGAYEMHKKNGTDKIFDEIVAEYGNSRNIDYNEAFRRVSEIDESSKYTSLLILLIEMSPKLFEYYREDGIDEKICFDTLADLKFKTLECYATFEKWGIFVPEWYPGFYKVARFALGRLQFETVAPQIERNCGLKPIKKEDILINIHIPSNGRLEHKDCINAYKAAYGFYKKYAENGILTFMCHSWLLHPGLEEILSESSNILAFRNDFEIFNPSFEERFHDLWRVYGKYSDREYKDLPENTQMQRNMKEYLLSGKQLGSAYGMFFFDGKTVLH